MVHIVNLRCHLALLVMLVLMSACAHQSTSPPPTTSVSPSCIMGEIFAPENTTQREALLENLLQQYRATRQGSLVWVDMSLFYKDVMTAAQAMGLVRKADIETLQADEAVREAFHARYLDFILSSNHLRGDVVSRSIDGALYVDWRRFTAAVVPQGCIHVPDPNYAHALVAEVQSAIAAAEAEREAAAAAEREAEAARQAEERSARSVRPSARERLNASSTAAWERRSRERIGQRFQGVPQSHTEAFLSNYFHDIPAMVEVARCESSFGNTQSGLRYRVGERRGQRERSFGFFQIHEPDWHATAVELGLENYQTDPIHNVLLARHLYELEGLHPWRNSRNCWGPRVGRR